MFKENVMLNDHLMIKQFQDFKLIKYNKKFITDENITTLGKWRSVIFHNEKMVSTSPIKSTRLNQFIKTNNIQDCYVQEFVEGTMINCFFIPTIGWEIATKSNVGANCKFQSKKTFREMFLEIFSIESMENVLDQKYVYSFVMQHPENKIVAPIPKARIVLVELYKIINEEIIPQDIYNLTTYLELPNIYCLQADDTWETIIERFNDCEWYKVGCIIKNKHTNQRTKVRNKNYEQIHNLKGKNNKLKYIYYSLRKSKKIQQYLENYPEHKKLFDTFCEELHVWTYKLLSNYRDCFIHKKATLKEYPFAFRIHMYNLHQIYLKQLRPNNLYINKNIVIDHVNNLDPAALMYLINLKKLRQKGGAP